MQLGAGPGRGLQGERDQVRLGIVQFANFATVIGARGIEITQAGIAECVSAIVSLESPLKEQLRHAIGIYRLAWNVFLDRNFGRLSIHGAGGGKDELVYSGIQSRVQQRQSALDVVLKILSGI